MDKILVKIINLDRRSDRLEDFYKKIKYLNLNSDQIERFSAIDGRNLIDDLKNKKIQDPIINLIANKDGFLRCGEVACTLSHYLLLKQISMDDKIEDVNIIFIFEDDIFINDEYLKIEFSEIINNLIEFNKSNEWDLIYMGGRFHPNFKCTNTNISVHTINNFYEQKYKDDWRNFATPMEWDRTAHNLVVTKKSATKLVNEMYNYINLNNICVADHLIHDRYTIKKYDYFPHIFYSPMNYTSDIQGNSNNNQIELKEFGKLL
jgi:GR25 family glycosyltransferase involved in LPS biosynthesis